MRYRQTYLGACLFSAALLLAALCIDASSILPGLRIICFSQDVLITDYIAIAGLSATLVNVALVELIGVFIFRVTHEVLNGTTIVALGLMAGFAFFGKNVWNIWPIIFGVFLYARFQREPPARYAATSLLATALAPLVSFIALPGGLGNPAAAILVGLGVGFVLAPLSGYTFRIQNGMSLYNLGFACGLLALIIVPVLNSLGNAPSPVLYWATGYNLPLGIALAVLCLIFILTGLFGTGKPPWAVWAGYRKLLRASGRAPSDYLRMFGGGPVLLNMGVNGLIGTAYILAIGGDLNGPTIGGILTIVAFSGFGKHARNITPVMLGVVLGGVFMRWSINDPAVQLAGLFCTTLAPIAGYFGWPYGLLAGFLHSSVVLHAGTAAEGINLYNNGFSGGLIATVLYPVITAVASHRKPMLQEEDFFDSVEQDAPISPDGDPPGPCAPEMSQNETTK